MKHRVACMERGCETCRAIIRNGEDEQDTFDPDDRSGRAVQYKQILRACAVDFYGSATSYLSDSRFRSPDPHGVEELLGYMYDLSQHFDCGWRNGIEHALWHITSAWSLRRERLKFPYDGDDDEDVTVLDSAYLERLAFLARWTDGWIFNVSRDTPHLSVPPGFYGPIYVTTEEWLTICEHRSKERRVWDMDFLPLEEVK